MTSAFAIPPSHLLSVEALQRIIDEAAIFNLYALAEVGRAAQGDGEGNCAVLYRFDIEMATPTVASGVRVKNEVGPRAGEITYRIAAIPWHQKARPDRVGQEIPIDSRASQRIVISECHVALGRQGDGFECFGTGRTFPIVVGNRPQLAMLAIANISNSFGVFDDLEGNLTFCGILTEGNEFEGHIMVRVIDNDGKLRVSEMLPVGAPSGRKLDADVTFMNFVGQKDRGPDEENRFSVRVDGQPRGLNISTRLKSSAVGFDPNVATDLKFRDLRTGENIGREIGFGPLPPSTIPSEGVPLRPFPFEGVARYGFHDELGREIGTLTSNVLEGRRFDVCLQEAVLEPAYRFGFFGPIVIGTGCFRGVTGLFYGASGSFLSPPPGKHVVTHFYAAMLADPNLRYRQNTVT